VGDEDAQEKSPTGKERKEEREKKKEVSI